MPKIIYYELKEKDYDYLSNFLKKGKAFVREVKRAEALLLHHNHSSIKIRIEGFYEEAMSRREKKVEARNEESRA